MVKTTGEAAIIPTPPFTLESCECPTRSSTTPDLLNDLTNLVRPGLRFSPVIYAANH
jgi:hypothetical protein